MVHLASGRMGDRPVIYGMDVLVFTGASLIRKRMIDKEMTREKKL